MQTPLTAAVLMVSPLQMALTLKDAVSLILKTAARPTSDAALTESPQLLDRITMAVACRAMTVLTDAVRME